MNEVEEKVPTVGDQKIFLKATGPNRYAGGSSNWLLVRSIKKNNDGSYELKVNIGGRERFVDIIDIRYGVNHLKFKLRNGKDIKFDEILKGLGSPVQLKLFKESVMSMIDTELNVYTEKLATDVKELFMKKIAPATRKTHMHSLYNKVKSSVLSKVSKSMDLQFSEGESVMNESKFNKFIEEEIKLAIEDLIRPIDEKTITSDIAREISPSNNKFVQNVLKTSFVSSGVVTFVQGTDGQQYEIVVRPLRFGQYKDMVMDSRNEEVN